MMPELSEKAELELAQQIDADLTRGFVKDGQEVFYIAGGSKIWGYFDNDNFYIDLVDNQKCPPLTQFEG